MAPREEPRGAVRAQAKALLIEDHSLMLEALTHSLGMWLPGVQIIKACTWREAQERLQDSELAYAFVLSDLHMAGAAHDAILQALRLWRPDTPILVMSNLTDAATLALCGHYRILHLSKKASAPQLQEMLMSCLGPELWQQCAQLPEDGSHPLKALTQRQLAILQEVARGCSNRDIAASLGISAETVHSHLRAIFKRLQVKNRTQASKLFLDRNHHSTLYIHEKWLT